MWKASFCIFVLLGAVSLFSCGSGVDTPSLLVRASDLPGDWSKHKPVDDGFDGPCDGEYISAGKFVGGDIKEVAYEQKDIGPFFLQYLISFEKESEAKNEFDRIVFLWEKCASQVYWDDPVSPRSITQGFEEISEDEVYGFENFFGWTYIEGIEVFEYATSLELIVLQDNFILWSSYVWLAEFGSGEHGEEVFLAALGYADTKYTEYLFESK
ncbi:MAG: hypothetical protein ACJ0J7_03735 [Tepidiformaceae bacterium]